ncbi:hypothetical protein HPB51_005777 [Rhipicephalus microplus]|uniref:Uncharacterized protein n=1 Tax=Rhipicephalus microplus TaxID=6941 RepID=A0A9J6EMN1_RHIMP|nr:hypothetical protein HPB51_005777 [Rhipicephalus microplus]
MMVRDLNAGDVHFVVNYDYPRSSDDHALRVKHAVRDSRKGRAYTFLAPTQKRNAKELIRILRDAGQEVPQELFKAATDIAAEAKVPPEKLPLKVGIRPGEPAAVIITLTSPQGVVAVFFSYNFKILGEMHVRERLPADRHPKIGHRVQQLRGQR